MSKRRKRTLQQAGIDPERYLSMRIDKEQIPDGAEVVITIRDKDTGELRELSVNADDDQYFGRHSQFYRQVMADGNIFNPYIHRRFLPAQFRRNIRYAGYNGIHDYVKQSYNWNYVVRFLKEECAKLAMLEKRDREAYLERSRFFTLGDMKDILTEYGQKVCEVLDREYESVKNVRHPRRGQGKVYICPKGMGMIQKEHVRPMKHRFTKFCEDVQNARSYAQLSKVLESFEFARLDNDIPSSDTFARCFNEEGAFYTLKQMIMFENLTLGGTDVAENMRKMQERGKYGFLALYRLLAV